MAENVTKIVTGDEQSQEKGPKRDSDRTKKARPDGLACAGSLTNFEPFLTILELCICLVFR
jgi:hypothetical protein